MLAVKLIHAPVLCPCKSCQYLSLLFTDYKSNDIILKYQVLDIIILPCIVKYLRLKFVLLNSAILNFTNTNHGALK